MRIRFRLDEHYFSGSVSGSGSKSLNTESGPRILIHRSMDPDPSNFLKWKMVAWHGIKFNLIKFGNKIPTGIVPVQENNESRSESVRTVPVIRFIFEFAVLTVTILL